jgi:hypothetical protein
MISPGRTQLYAVRVSSVPHRRPRCTAETPVGRAGQSRTYYRAEPSTGECGTGGLGPPGFHHHEPDHGYGGAIDGGKNCPAPAGRDAPCQIG